MAQVLSKSALVPHPASAAAPVRLGTKLSLVGTDVLKAEFVAIGDIGRVLIPAPAIPERRDELWRHTCFELFFREGASGAYHEFNFAPSRHWAAYRFDSYREGMAPSAVTGVDIYLETDPTRFALTAWLDVRPFRGIYGKHVSLTAVIEETDGTKSYWALAHPPGKPDFHDPACFVLELPAAGTA
ncbi:hypothetical protein TS85_08635 [Sphingomonas hengshuiensis]|uniref:DOMON-like domain-containing protein n=2 Tax=Sphingomonas hengshuiensis TaxID=1609977 RepID=A0A7U5BFM2_9SPHN|nr:hypothetical protein TS85_08635 [Sphingomonas hengshuiensis]